MHDNAVVITGCGAASALGIGWEAFAEAMATGRTGIGDLVSFDASDLARERAAEIHDFDAAAYLRSPKNFLDRNSALGFAVCEQAVRQSGLKLPAEDRAAGLMLGSMGGNIETLKLFHDNVQKKGPRLAPPFLFPHTYWNATAGLLAIEYGLGGPHHQFCSGAAAGMEAIIHAARNIAADRANTVIAGGVEAFGESLFRAAVSRGWVSPIDGGSESCLPFNPARNGAILGEGAALFVLESAASAEARGAKPIAYIIGTGIAPSPEEAMKRASASANMSTDKIDAVFSAAGGYPEADAREARALADLFADTKTPVVAMKAFFGETLGASGPLNLAAALAAMESGAIPVPCFQCAPDGPHLATAPAARLRCALVNAGGPTLGLWASVLVSPLRTP